MIHLGQSLVMFCFPIPDIVDDEFVIAPTKEKAENPSNGKIEKNQMVFSITMSQWQVNYMLFVSSFCQFYNIVYLYQKYRVKYLAIFTVYVLLMPFKNTLN